MPLETLRDPAGKMDIVSTKYLGWEAGAGGTQVIPWGKQEVFPKVGDKAGHFSGETAAPQS